MGRPALFGLMLLALASPELDAQQPMFGASFGRSTLDSPGFDRHFHNGITGAGKGDMGLQFQAFSEWSPGAAPFTLRAEAMFHRARGGGAHPNTAELDQVFALGGSLVWPRVEPEGFEVYLIGGGSLFVNGLGLRSVVNGEVTHTDWAWGPALNWGVGAAFDVFGLRTGLEVRQQQGFFQGRGNGWIGIAVPLRLR